MTTTEWINELIERDELWRFYKSKEWTKLKEQVLRDNHYECRICKMQGIVTRYDIGADGKRRRISTVHHVREVRKHPELALTRAYRGTDGRMHDNLIPICRSCHNKVHDRSFNGSVGKRKRFTTPERW